MSTVNKIISFDYNDVSKVILTEGIELDPSTDVVMTKIPGKRNEYKYVRSDNNLTIYKYIRIFKTVNNEDIELANISDIVFDPNITTLYFKYIINDSDIEFTINDSPLNMDEQYSGISKHNELYVKYPQDQSDHSAKYWDIHFDKDVGVEPLDIDDFTPATEVIDLDKYEQDIKFNPTKSGLIKDNHRLCINTLVTYFSGDGLVVGCLYESNGEYYYLIKYSNPSGRNRCIKIPDKLISEYKKSGIFQLIEVFDNIVICTGVDLYSYNISNVSDYLPDSSNRSSSDNVHGSTKIFDLNNTNILVSNFRDTIDNPDYPIIEGSGEPESDFPSTENYYAFYLPMDIDYCRKFFAIKLNTYNCYEFHTGNLLARYNISDSDNQIHYIHSNTVSETKSTLSNEEYKVIGEYSKFNEGKEYNKNGQPSLVNDTSPYTNYDSYELNGQDKQVLNEVGKSELFLLTEIYLSLKHGVNCVNGRGDLLDKFNYFRILESGLCKFTKSISNKFIAVIYSNLLTNIKKFIFKLAYKSNDELHDIELNTDTLNNIYVQLSNNNLIITYYNQSTIYSTDIINLLEIDSGRYIENEYLVLNLVDSFKLLYKDINFSIDNNLDIIE